jgi:hypothetical protein
MTPQDPLKKFRYEFPATEARYLAAPSAEAAVQLHPPHLPAQRPSTCSRPCASSPRWPEFWKTVDDQGLQVPRALT